jgi:hypothetical protein
MPHELSGTGDWTDVEVGTHTETFWTRRTCCLWYLEDPGRSLCDTCNLLSPDERRLRLLRQATRRAAQDGP